MPCPRDYSPDQPSYQTGAGSRFAGGGLRWARLVALGSILLGAHAATAQGSPGASLVGTLSRAGSGSVDPYVVRGKVVNALTGAGISRALVTLASRRVLTDAQGQFEFPGYTQARGTMTASKPGYSTPSDATTGARAASSTDLTVPVQIALSPNALLAGVVSGRDGLPLAGLQAHLYQAVISNYGLVWVSTGSTQTNSHGEYRFSTPAGRYRVSVGYLARARETGEAVLPAAFPENSSSDRFNSFTLANGEERRVDLRPKTGVAAPLLMHVLPADVHNIRFSVTDNAGETFFVSAESQSDSNAFHISLPAGTYVIRGRVDDRDAAQEGTTRVSVGARTGTDALMQMSPVPAIPVELTVDPAGSTPFVAGTSNLSTTPTPRQFNLLLHNLKNLGQGVNTDVNLLGGGNVPFQFRVAPGRYRLQGNQGGTWHVESATYGQTDLLTSELVVAQGSGAATIRIVADNRTGMLQGSVRLPVSVASAWVYLIPRMPSLGVQNPVIVDPAGTFSMRVAIGSYDVIAVDHPLQMDLRDPEVLGRFSTGAKALEMTANATVTLGLDLAQEKGASQ